MPTIMRSSGVRLRSSIGAIITTIVIGLPESVLAIVHGELYFCIMLFLKDKKSACFGLKICRKSLALFALGHLVE